MSHLSIRPDVKAILPQHTMQVIGLVGINLIFNIVANSSFKASAASHNWRHFIVWQVIGNLAGLVTVITLTWLLRFTPLSVAYPVTIGLAVIGVQVVGSRLIFGEAISSTQWLGTVLVVTGIIFIGGR